jgi:CheY-like chemotaxis protein
LIVDDEPGLRQLFRINLEHRDYRVSEAPDGFGAIDAARHDRPDLILLDLSMPNKDGWDVLAELGTDPDLGQVPVVILTGQADEGTEWRARELGAVTYVAKPVDIEDLVSAMERVIGASSG